MKTSIKNGISLIVLVITIIVMIILAATIIISLNNTGIIGAAENAVCMTNIKQAQNLAVLVWSNIYTNPDEYTMDNVEQKLKEEFEKNGLKYEDYNVEVTKNGIEVSSKAGCVDSSGVEGGNGDSGNGTIPTNWEHAYTYNRAADEWTAVATNEGVEPTGDVVIRMYNLGASEKTIVGDEVNASITGDFYKMLISGTGKIDFNGFLDSSITEPGFYDEEEQMPIMYYTVDLEIQEGITEVSCYNTYWEGAFGLIDTVKLPSTLRVIGEDFMYINYCLEEIEIPEGVTTIAKDAFGYCEKLRTVKLPDSLTKLGASAFAYTAINEIRLPKNLTELETYSARGPFERCKELKIVTIPASIENLNNAFYDCENIETVYYEGTEEQWNAVEKKCIPTTATIVYNYNYTGN